MMAVHGRFMTCHATGSNLGISSKSSPAGCEKCPLNMPHGRNSAGCGPGRKWRPCSGIYDRYELIKGPAQVLYLNASLSGVAIKSTRKPLPFNQNILTFLYDQWGTYRATLDSTGPIGTLGDAKISYRLVAAVQDGSYYYYNFSDRRKVIFPVIQIDFKSTIVRINYLYERLNLWPAGQDLISPSGAIYTGWGRREGGYPPNDMTYQPENRYSLDVTQKVSDNWQDRLTVGVWDFVNYGSNATPAGGLNWAAQTVTYTNRLNNVHYQYWTILDDVQGNYHIGPIKNIDAAGFGWDEYTTDQETWTTAGFGSQVIPLRPPRWPPSTPWWCRAGGSFRRRRTRACRIKSMWPRSIGSTRSTSSRTG